jgi:hypothetical protein
MSNVLDRQATAEAPQDVEKAVTDAIDMIVWDVLGSKGRKRACVALERRAARYDKLATEALGLASNQRPENVVRLWVPRLRGVDKALHDERQLREANERAAELTNKAAALRRLIGEVF